MMNTILAVILGSLLTIWSGVNTRSNENRSSAEVEALLSMGEWRYDVTNCAMNYHLDKEKLGLSAMSLMKEDVFAEAVHEVLAAPYQQGIGGNNDEAMFRTGVIHETPCELMATYKDYRGVAEHEQVSDCNMPGFYYIFSYTNKMKDEKHYGQICHNASDGKIYSQEDIDNKPCIASEECTIRIYTMQEVRGNGQCETSLRIDYSDLF